MSRVTSRAALLLAVAAWGGCTKNPSTNKATCPSGEKANSAGICVQCLTTADCSAGTFCNSANICSGCAQSPSSCSVDGGNPNGSCSTDTDCPSGKYCANYVCQPGCSTDSECPSGDVCTNNACVAIGAGSCAEDAGVCGGESCCSGVCTNTMSDNRANCGGCGAGPCMTGDSCCAGVCADTQTDPMNCGTCGMACGGSIMCTAGNCQNGYAILGLFDVTGKIAIAGDAGTSSASDAGPAASDGGTADAGPTSPSGTVEVLEPYMLLASGNPPISATQQGLEMLLSGPVCQAFHYDPMNPLPASLNAGTITISGYTGGDVLGTSTMVPNQVLCTILNGVYVCGYGALLSSMPGAPPAEQDFASGTNAIGTSAVTFAAPGTPAGPTSFGSFSVMSSGNTGLPPVSPDLSTLTYSSSTDTVINLVCPSGGCSLGGYFAVVQASSNPAAHFAEPAMAGGSIYCVGGYGTVPVLDQTLPPVITFQASDIGTMLGSDASIASTITTFTTTVVTISEGSLTSLNQTDSEGHHIIPLAATGVFGVAAQN